MQRQTVRSLIFRRSMQRHTGCYTIRTLIFATFWMQRYIKNRIVNPHLNEAGAFKDELVT